MSKDKKSKKCLNRSRLIWYVFSTAGLGARVLAAIALLAIAVKVYPLKYQAKYFNACVEQTKNTGQSVSQSVRYCNGGM